MRNAFIYGLFILLMGCVKSNPVPTSPVESLPNAPTEFKGVLTSPIQVDLTWSDASSNEDGFKIERKSGTGAYSLLTTLSQNSVKYSDKGLDVGTIYTYRLISYNTKGNSSYSNEITIKAEVKLDNLSWAQVSTGNCWRVIPNIDSTVLFLSRATDVLKSTNLGIDFVSTGFTFPVIRESLGTVAGGAYSNFNGGQLVIAGMDKGYYMSNNNAVAFASTGPMGFGCGSQSILALSDGRFIASMAGFQRGVYKSSGTDNQTWINKYPGLDPNDFSQSGNIIFSATTGTVGGNGFILKSTNQGETWTNELSSNASSGFICDVELLNDTLFFINSKGNFYASSISSINTNSLRSNIPTSAYIDCVYSGIYKVFVAVSDNSGIYISNNRGLTWTRYTIPGVTVYNKVSVVKNKIFVSTTTGLYSTTL